jgi:organic hydroperoxide reductase OsmC/OhrA
MAKTFQYHVTVRWSGNKGSGTAGYESYGRDMEISSSSKPAISGSSDPAFLGDAAKWNPEEMLVASISACHQLWYLHLCSDAEIIVTQYIDKAEGEMEASANTPGHFTRVVLHPKIVIAPGGDLNKARELHHEAHKQCFIANSVNFEVSVEPEIRY